MDRSMVTRHVRPFHWREAMLCAPAIPVTLAVGWATGAVFAATVAAGAAFSVGFGAARELGGQRSGAMIAAAIGTALAALVGTLAGTIPAVSMMLACAMAAVCAALALYDEDAWWVCLQMVIATLVASYYPGPLMAGLDRAALVLAGGVAQIACVLLIRRLAPSAAGRLSRNPPPARPSHSAVVWHMVRAVACVGGALALAWRLDLANSYWAPMTALIVLKPGLRDTGLRGMQRIGGTMAGAVGATLFAIGAIALSGWTQPLMILGIGVAATAAFALQKAHYAALTAAITAVVVLLVTFAHGPVIENAEHRLAATLLGGAAALAGAWIAPRRPRWLRRAEDRVGHAI